MASAFCSKERNLEERRVRYRINEYEAEKQKGCTMMIQNNNGTAGENKIKKVFGNSFEEE